MFIADGHCDSIMRLHEGNPLVCTHNFSAKHPQVQMTAIFSHTTEKFYEYLRDFQAALACEHDCIEQVRDYDEIESVLGKGKHAALLTMEGGAGITSAQTVRDFYDVGVRVMGLAWHSTDMAVSSRFREEGIPDTGLSPLGREVIAAGNACGMIFDVSHLSDESTLDVLECAQKPPVATHSSMRALCEHSRNLPDELARALVARGGMIGINLYPPFLQKDSKACTVAHYFAHVDYALSLVGANAVGLGGDIDGVGGRYPAPLNEQSSIPDDLMEYMARHNYTDELIQKVMGANWLSFLQRWL